MCFVLIVKGVTFEIKIEVLQTKTKESYHLIDNIKTHVRYEFLIHSNHITHKTNINLNMFRASMLNGIGSQINDTHIITINKSSIKKWCMSLTK